MSEIKGDNLRKLQAVLLEMLVEVDRICRKNSIEYSLDSGTLIGAVRHDGFIPWDDDADVVMLRSEYDKFAAACKSYLDTDKFFLQDFYTEPEYRWGYAKLRRNNTLFLKEGQEFLKWHQGIFIDIFIYDGVPDNFFLRRLHAFACYCIRKGLYSVVGKEMSDAFMLRKWYSLLYKLPRSFWVGALEYIAKITGENGHELVRHMTYPCGFPHGEYGMPRSSFDDYIDKDFEGHMFRIFKNYDFHLTCMYGDYMTIPPEDKREGQNVKKVVFPDGTEI